MTNTSTARIAKDLKEINSIADLDAPPIYCHPVGDELDHLVALIVGPPETPYEFGFFRFDLKFSQSYPNKPPKVMILNTDRGKTRLNPNLYAGGKVCLSILGTWTGESADEWRSTYSIHYLLRAIQSLIMTQKPFHNEPGYETINEENGKPEDVINYSAKIKHEVLRITVCDAIQECFSKEPPPFADLMKNHFLTYFYRYVQQASDNVEYDTPFQMMAFEYPENGATGTFKYTKILERLHELKGKIESEAEEWKEKGHEHTKAESGWKYYRLIEENELIKKGSSQLDGMSAGPVTDANLFHWNASIFGPENTLFEGGFFSLEIIFNDKDCPPRVRFLCDMWHPNITKDGYPFIVVSQESKNPVIPILLAIKKLLQSEPNSSSATWVNMEAANQYFSKKDEDKKEYRRKVSQFARRTVGE
eukprot:TRINITY_DN7153_c0_g1_i1.p1 TRINITY_DN7153_c0_g1~~TRINITY_DN7153_c0_g1_i1.p1  ORF type:complete len:419 (+),score=120.03 TRINITY_DN7153_c0_g1_i1:132-1388(+)